MWSILDIRAFACARLTSLPKPLIMHALTGDWRTEDSTNITGSVRTTRIQCARVGTLSKQMKLRHLRAAGLESGLWRCTLHSKTHECNRMVRSSVARWGVSCGAAMHVSWLSSFPSTSWKPCTRLLSLAIDTLFKNIFWNFQSNTLVTTPAQLKVTPSATHRLKTWSKVAGLWTVNKDWVRPLMKTSWWRNAIFPGIIIVRLCNVR